MTVMQRSRLLSVKRRPRLPARGELKVKKVALQRYENKSLQTWKKKNYFQVIRNEGYKVSQKIGWEFEAKS